MSALQQEPAVIPQDTATDAAERLTALIATLIAESRPQRDAVPARVSLDMDFDSDLGLDSLARVELLSRVEKGFGLVLDDRVFADARTPRALLTALTRAGDLPMRPVNAGSGQAPALSPGPAARPAPASLETLTAVLEWHAEHHPERVHIRFHEDGSDGRPLSYHGLLSGARRIASGLQSIGLERGEPVVLMLQTEPDYFFCFFGILLAGGIPVPIYPPARPDQIEDHLLRQAAILDNCAAPILITLPEGRTVARLLKSRVDSLRRVVTPAELVAAANVPLARPTIGADDLAFLQYTSGSTGAPKGVMLTHANLLANIRAMAQQVEATPDDVFVSWLPLYHDLGLIGAWLGSLYCATPLIVMSPIAFITRPLRWLQALHRHRATISASPNFGYELCLQRIADEDLAGLDLSRWRVACNGAEPVSPDTLERFHARFAPCGLRREALMPVYGLAECSVGLTFPPLDRGPLIDRIRREPFLDGGLAVPAGADDATALRFPSCGAPLPGHAVRIVDDQGAALPDRVVGRLLFRGPSATQGYYRNPEATRRLRQGDWLDSGDLAYSADGEIRLTGRAKDVIILAGRNLYPHEIEEAVGQIDGLRAGRVAAFGVRDPALGSERLVIVAETRARDADTRSLLRARIRETATARCSTPPDDVVLAAPGTVPKTPSGKIRRTACRERYERGDLDRPPLAVWRQLLRVSRGTLPRLFRRAVRGTPSALRVARAHATAWPLALLTWLLVVILPSRGLRWQATRAAVGLWLTAIGVRMDIEGREYRPVPDRGAILVANHASYLDALLLMRALPDPVAFVAKSELRERAIVRIFLQRLGVVFVERFDTRQGASDTRDLIERARAGDRLLFFPEGTFTRAPGLRPFRMGAFATAAAAGLPLYPVALRGSRALLPDGSRGPSPGTATVRFLPPVTAPEVGDEWSRALTLRDSAAAALLAHCGEPALLEVQAGSR